MTDKPAKLRATTRRFLFKKVRKRTAEGAPPGQLLPDPAAYPTSLHLTLFDAGSNAEVSNASLHDVEQAHAGKRLLWLDIVGLRDLDMLQSVARLFDIHPLAREDIVNTYQRAKTDDYGAQLYVVTHLVQPGGDFDTEQVSIVIGANYVLTFQEVPDDTFAALRTRLCAAGSRLRNMGPDYLAYTVIDAALDSYFPAMEAIGERLESLEEEIIGQASSAAIESIHQVRHQLLAMRRAIWPHREMLSTLLRQNNPLVQPGTEMYLRDCYDHVVQLIDMLENFREIASGMFEIHLSNQSNRLSEVMKVLTIIATIFIPLSFIASVYGMNFDTSVSRWNMPELAWRFGYFFALGLMALTALGLLYFFWRRGWLSKRK